MGLFGYIQKSSIISIYVSYCVRTKISTSDNLWKIQNKYRSNLTIMLKYLDHIHMLVSILYKLIVSSFMGYLKGKSSLMIFVGNANFKYKYECCKFSF